MASSTFPDPDDRTGGLNKLFALHGWAADDLDMIMYTERTTQLVDQKAAELVADTVSAACDIVNDEKLKNAWKKDGMRWTHGVLVDWILKRACEMRGFEVKPKGEKKEEKKKPKLRHMIVSVNRYRGSSGGGVVSCQFPLWECLKETYNNDSSDRRPDTRLRLSALDWEIFVFNVQEKFKVDLYGLDLSIVWQNSESGQLGIITGKSSFQAAILDHRHAGKTTIQLYVVNSDDMGTLPEHFPNSTIMDSDSR